MILLYNYQIIVKIKCERKLAKLSEGLTFAWGEITLLFIL